MPFTYAVMGINLVIFALMTVADANTLSGNATWWHLRLGLNAELIAGTSEWYRLITAGFIHYGIIHIAFNMYILFALGRMLEPSIGSVRFGMAYLASLLTGSFGALLLQPDGLTAGASGAVFGLMGLGFVGYWLNGVNPFNTGIGTLLVMNLALTFMIGGLSIGGHLGGAIGGAICGLAMMQPPWKKVSPLVTYAVPVALAAISVVGSIMVVG